MSGDTLEARLVEFADWLDDGNCDAAAALVLEARDALAAAHYALWVAAEHNALHFGETHNTVSLARGALAKLDGKS